MKPVSMTKSLDSTAFTRQLDELNIGSHGHRRRRRVDYRRHAVRSPSGNTPSEASSLGGWTGPWLDQLAAREANKTAIGSGSESSASPNKVLRNCHKLSLKTRNVGASAAAGGAQHQSTSSCVLPHLMPLAHTFTALERLDLVGNSIDLLGAKQLAAFMERRGCRVSCVLLCRCHLSDAAAAIICGALQHNSTVRTLNLARNTLKSKSLRAIGAALATNSTLRELLLPWNNVCGAGLADGLAVGLSLNRGSLRTLDLSFNLLGRTGADGLNGVPALAEALRLNKGLTAIDLTSCQLNPQEVRVLAASLLGNKTLFSIKFAGNAGAVDAKGYVRTLPAVSLFAGTGTGPDHAAAAPLQITATGGGEPVRQLANDWSEAVVKYTPGVSGPPLGDADAQRLRVHLACDQWLPEPLKRLPAAPDAPLGAPPSYGVVRALPPGKTWYFFSLGGGDGDGDGDGGADASARPMVARDQPMEDHPRLGVRRNVARTHALSETVTKLRRRMKPRSTPWAAQAVDAAGATASDRLSALPAAWDLQTSLFAARREEHGALYSADLVAKAVESDVDLSKIRSMKLVESDDEMYELADALSSVYLDLDALFWHLACEDMQSKSGAFCLSWPMWRLFAEETCLGDGQVSVSRMRELFVVTNVELQAEADNDDESLVRFEFAEFLVRIALERYLFTGEGSHDTVAQAFLHLFDEALAPYLREHVRGGRGRARDAFRHDHLYTEPAELACAKHGRRLAALFADAARGEATLGLPGWLALVAGGLGCTEDSEPLNTTNATRDCFQRATPLCVHIPSTRNERLSFVDFVESLLRVAAVYHAAGGPPQPPPRPEDEKRARKAAEKAEKARRSTHKGGRTRKRGVRKPPATLIGTFEAVVQCVVDAVYKEDSTGRLIHREMRRTTGGRRKGGGGGAPRKEPVLELSPIKKPRGGVLGSE